MKSHRICNSQSLPLKIKNSPTTGALILRQFKRPLNLMKNLAEPEELQRFLNKQQKNLVLWHGQSWVRKGLEVPTTALMEIFWPKERILEVYLNIAEFGNGIFGVEAASRYYFKKSAKNLTQSEAALLAAVLPNPIIYKVNKPSALVRKKQSWIMGQMNGLGLNYLKEM